MSMSLSMLVCHTFEDYISWSTVFTINASGPYDKYYVSLRVLSRAFPRTADQAKIVTATFFLEPQIPQSQIL